MVTTCFHTILTLSVVKIHPRFNRFMNKLSQRVSKRVRVSVFPLSLASKRLRFKVQNKSKT